MGCIIEMKEGQNARTSCYFGGICFLRTVSPCQNFLYSILFPGLELNGEWSGDFSGEASTPQNHLVTDPSHFSQSISLSFSLTVFHLTPLSPATCLSKPSQSSLYLSLHFLLLHALSSSSSPLFPQPPALILVMPSPQLLCQCV